MAKLSTLKRYADDAMSKYVRLRDAIEWNLAQGEDIINIEPKNLLVKCCTCPTIRLWPRMQAGHYHSKGLGGASGARYDERNVHTQCAICNSFNEGQKVEYHVFMSERYSRKVLDELIIIHNTQKRFWQNAGYLRATKIMYDQMYKDLIRKYWR